MVLEQGHVVNFSTTHTSGYRRNLNNNFAPYVANPDGWQMLTYTYDAATGIAACYKNNQLVLSGAMTTNTANGSPTTAGTSLVYTNYTSGTSSTGFTFYGGTTTAANPNGNGFCPGEISNIMVYNKALSIEEVRKNFNALRGRFDI